MAAKVCILMILAVMVSASLQSSLSRARRDTEKDKTSTSITSVDYQQMINTFAKLFQFNQASGFTDNFSKIPGVGGFLGKDDKKEETKEETKE